MSFKNEITFALDFLKLWKNADSESMIFSSASILNGLAMILAATKGKSAEEIAKIIGRDAQFQEILEYYSKTCVNQNFGEDEDGKEVEVIFTNQFFVSKNETLNSEFSNLMQEMFRNTVKSVDYENPHDAGDNINKFVEKSTNGQIKNVIEISDINPKTSIILINALHFCSNWNQNFRPREPEIFKSNPPRKVDMMLKMEMDWNYNEGEDWEALGIPYKSNHAYMYIILPKENDGLTNLLEKMDLSLFLECTKPNTDYNIKVQIPCFETIQTFDLKEQLQKLGVKEVFGEGCDLSRMFKNKQKIDKIVHKAVIKVDEYGTEASAVTQIGAMRCSKKEWFIADHPFLYFITLNKPAENGYKNEYIPKKLLFVGTFC